MLKVRMQPRWLCSNAILLNNNSQNLNIFFTMRFKDISNFETYFTLNHGFITF